MHGKRVSQNTQSGETAPEGVASTLSVLAVGLFVLTFIFQNFAIPSSSMASTLLVGDHVVVDVDKKQHKLMFKVAKRVGEPAAAVK